MLHRIIKNRTVRKTDCCSTKLNTLFPLSANHLSWMLDYAVLDIKRWNKALRIPTR